MAGRSRATFVAMLVVCALVASGCDLPTLKEAREEAAALPQTSFLYAADGTLITRLHAGEDRVVVRASRIPDVMRNAVIAIEDQRFYDHAGVDLRALLRAAYIDATTGQIVEGGSTITQQLVKQVYVGSDETLDRKIREAYLAWQMEQRFTKEQILTKYLNTVYFGNGAYGILAASRTYFDEEPMDLTLAQAAFLAGVIAAPVTYDPVTHPGRARNRRNRVLARMLDLGMIDQASHDAASAAPLDLTMTQDAGQPYLAPYFVDYFKEWFLSNPRFGATQEERYDLLFEGGLRIVTTVDPRMQRAAERAIDSVLLYRTDPYAALTAIDPRTGYVRAMVGGRDYWNEHDRFARINLATGGSTGRQAGSAFKPFALVAALESGLTRTHAAERLRRAHPAPGRHVLGPAQRRGKRRTGRSRSRAATVNSVNVAYANLVVADGRRRPVRRGAEARRRGRPHGHPVLPPNDRAEHAARRGALRGARRERGEHAGDGLGVRNARVRRGARAADAGDQHHDERRRGPLPGQPAAEAGGRAGDRVGGRRHPQGGRRQRAPAPARTSGARSSARPGPPRTRATRGSSARSPSS